MLTKREWLVDLAEQCGITILETIPASAPNDGLYFTCCNQHIILMKKSLPDSQFIPVLAEEIGHCASTYGIVIELSDVGLIKSENYGRAWAIEFLLPICKFAFASIVNRCKTAGDYAEVFNLDEAFIADAIDYYKRKGYWPQSFQSMYRFLLKSEANKDNLAM